MFPSHFRNKFAFPATIDDISRGSLQIMNTNWYRSFTTPESKKREYGFLHDNPTNTLIMYLFTVSVTSPNMDFEATFFGQLFRVLPSVLQEVVKLL